MSLEPMARASWQRVRKALGRSPIVEGEIGGDCPLYVERYLFQTRNAAVPALDCTGFLHQTGGSRVSEGERDQWRSQNLPSQSLLVPPDVATQWHYTGTMDFAAFYFRDESCGMEERLSLLGKARGAPISLSDTLVAALAQQIVGELQKGSSSDAGFMARLAEMMLEQMYRVLTTPGTHGINPRHVHFPRLQAVLEHIHAHLAGDLSASALATRAELSLAHFRRIFEDAMGVPPHRYVLGLRLERARVLLTTTAMPIAHISQECGFSSQSHLTSSFRTAHAATPAEYRRQIAAARVRKA